MEAKTETVPCEVRGELKREEQWLAKRRKHMAVLRNDHTSRSSNSFNERLAILSRFLAHTLVAHGRPAKKHVPRLLTLIHTCRFKGY